MVEKRKGVEIGRKRGFGGFQTTNIKHSQCNRKFLEVNVNLDTYVHIDYFYYGESRYKMIMHISKMHTCKIIMHKYLQILTFKI